MNTDVLVLLALVLGLSLLFTQSQGTPTTLTTLQTTNVVNNIGLVRNLGDNVHFADAQQYVLRRSKRDYTYQQQQRAAQKPAQSFIELILGIIDTLQFGKRKLGTAP